MNHKRLLNALAKVGATITNPHADNGKEPRYFVATGKNGTSLCWYVQKKWDDTVLEAVSVHNPHPDTDAMTDLFLETFHHSIKSSVASLV
jgi:triacylglycerol esterase/lipase EstA (alpha/beta hydrolase family)